jgi:hypothetical protein
MTNRVLRDHTEFPGPSSIRSIHPLPFSLLPMRSLLSPAFVHHLNFFCCLFYLIVNFVKNFYEASLARRSVIFQWNLLIFFANCLFVWNSLLYWALLVLRSEGRKSWYFLLHSLLRVSSLEGIAEVLNIVGCSAYMLSSAFPLIGYLFSPLSEPNERHLDQLIYFTDVFAMAIFVLDSILYLAVYARDYEITYRKSFWKHMFNAELFFSWDFLPLILNFLASEFFSCR